jgi:two-component system, OmpR family, alkaline phosphatase synthesis response regulator PhoP
MAAVLPLILVADDDKDFRELIVDFLHSKGFQTKTASNGEEAVAAAREMHPALVLMDIDMPKKTGFEATFELKQDPHTKDIKILYLSNLGDASWAETAEVNRRLAQQIGALDYFKKGGDLELLISQIRHHLAR